MNFKDYFTDKNGMGVLSTSATDGRVNAAVFARPHVLDDGSVAFIMGDKATHDNLQSNPHAAYLFKEEGEGWDGVRLYLKKTGEDTDQEKIKSMLRRARYDNEDKNATRYLVTFSVENSVPLVGSGMCPVEH